MKSRHLATLAIALSLLASSLFAEENRATLESAGLRAEKFEEFDKQMQEEVKKGAIVGCSAMLIKGDRVIYSKVWGEGNRDKKTPVEKDAIWRIYSMTKPITSVAIMQLVDSKKIQLDDPAAKYLPEFKSLQVLKGDESVPCKRQMTVRDLLRHTSGLTYGFYGDTEVDKKYRRARILSGRNIGEMTKKLGGIPLLYQPGTRWHYSVSTDVLGRVVEVASGMTFNDYLKKQIFDPLEMKDTYFTVPAAKLPRLVEMYRAGNDGLRTSSRFESYRFVDQKNEFYSGGGGLCSTMEDYLQFCRMLLHEGELNGKQIVSKKAVNEMFKNQLPKGSGRRGFQFGLGFRISPTGDRSWGGAAGTRFFVDPEKKLAGVYMIQIKPYRAKPYGDNFRRAVYGAMED